MADELWVWRHPRPRDAAGRCIGRTDLPVDPRKVRRLADRIRRTARRHGLPLRVATSPLRRCADVGRWLRRWGWQHTVVPALAEIDFGAWDGLPWADLPHDAFDAWCVDFLHAAPGGGEALDALFDRVATWRAMNAATIVVGHAGWMIAARWSDGGTPRPTRADAWPVAPAYGTCWRLPAQGGR